jgi:hypothetical protein
MIGIILTLLAFAVLVTNFLDNALLRDAHKKLLQQRFEAWWKIVEHYDKLQLALMCAAKTNECLDFTFGKSLFSKKVFFRSSIISTSILIITLSIIGIENHRSFGVTPWTSYNESMNSTLKIAGELSASNTIATIRQYNLTAFTPGLNPSTNTTIVNVNSNLFLFTITTNGVHAITHIFPLGHGGFTVTYQRYFEVGQTNTSTNDFGNVTSYANPLDEMSKEISAFRLEVSKYDTTFYVTAYSVIYFMALFVANNLLFILSLVICRTMLREVAITGRLISTFSMFFTNIVIVFVLCCFLLLCFTFIAVPILWLFIPTLYLWSEESLSAVVPLLSTAALTTWILSSGYAKLVVLIAFLPNLFAGIVGLFTLLALK